MYLYNWEFWTHSWHKTIGSFTTKQDFAMENSDELSDETSSLETSNLFVMFRSGYIWFLVLLTELPTVAAFARNIVCKCQIYILLYMKLYNSTSILVKACKGCQLAKSWLKMLSLRYSIIDSSMHRYHFMSSFRWTRNTISSRVIYKWEFEQHLCFTEISHSSKKFQISTYLIW